MENDYFVVVEDWDHGDVAFGPMTLPEAKALAYGIEWVNDAAIVDVVIVQQKDLPSGIDLRDWAEEIAASCVE